MNTKKNPAKEKVRRRKKKRRKKKDDEKKIGRKKIGRKIERKKKEEKLLSTKKSVEEMPPRGLAGGCGVKNIRKKDSWKKDTTRWNITSYFFT